MCWTFWSLSRRLRRSASTILLAKVPPHRPAGRLTLHSDCFDSRDTSVIVESEIFVCKLSSSIKFSPDRVVAVCLWLFVRSSQATPSSGRSERLWMLGREISRRWRIFEDSRTRRSGHDGSADFN